MSFDLIYANMGLNARISSGSFVFIAVIITLNNIEFIDFSSKFTKPGNCQGRLFVRRPA